MQIIFQPEIQSSHPVSTGQPGFQQDCRGHSPTCVNTPPQLDIIASIPAPSGPSQSTFAARNQANSGLTKRLSSWNGRVGSGTKLLTKQFYLSTLPDSPKIAAAIRQHWCIENGLHWTLDTLGKMLVECAHPRPQFVHYDALLSMRSIESQANTVSGRSQARSNG